MSKPCVKCGSADRYKSRGCKVCARRRSAVQTALRQVVKTPKPDLAAKLCIKCGKLDRYDNGKCRACAKDRAVSLKVHYPEKVKERNRSFYQRHSERIKARQREWAANHPDYNWAKQNPERYRVTRHKYIKNNIKRIKVTKTAWFKQHYAKNRVAIIAKTRAWKFANPEKYAAMDWKRYNQTAMVNRRQRRLFVSLLSLQDLQHKIITEVSK